MKTYNRLTDLDKEAVQKGQPLVFLAIFIRTLPQVGCSNIEFSGDLSTFLDSLFMFYILGISKNTIVVGFCSFWSFLRNGCITFYCNNNTLHVLFFN